ncbi:hypothetical protein HR45_08470 [Shewanella mangrovi]|uniref:Uncharacterized protein n=1 Tax=Shewanella mangrovi TaxID=1515746 RepID=A0A094JDB9_9GAMM|nr:hypothetical protein [Shewanella mangrovi]KFZ37870.1 hypothetical protein HR45_08470 [Shewanella mangrovi]
MKAIKGLMLLAYIAIVVGCYLHFTASAVNTEQRSELEQQLAQAFEEQGYIVNYVSAKVCYGVTPLRYCTKMD